MASLKDLQKFIENIAKLNFYKFELETEEFSIKLQSQPEVKVEQVATVQPVNQVVANTQTVNDNTTTPAVETNTKQQKKTDENLYTIKSPMVGTFYRKPAPDKPPFVEVGTRIKKGDIVCIVEAMKIFNEIEAEVDGEIVEILVEDATPVEFDQPLFLVKQN